MTISMLKDINTYTCSVTDWVSALTLQANMDAQYVSGIYE